MIWWIVAACAVAYLTKLSGYLLPQAWLDHPLVSKVMMATTIGLLAALVGMNSMTSEQRIVLDSRLLAVVVAALALRLKVPFIGVVLLGAASVAVGRLLGLP